MIFLQCVTVRVVSVWMEWRTTVDSNCTCDNSYHQRVQRGLFCDFEGVSWSQRPPHTHGTDVLSGTRNPRLETMALKQQNINTTL